MRRIFLFSIVLLMSIIVAVLPASAQNSPPLVSNVHSEQRTGTTLVDITYDVDDADGDALTISVAVSDDGGSTFTVSANSFTGDIGGGIAPGSGKHIIWNAGADVPNIYGNFRIKVTADDGYVDGGDMPGMALIPAGEFSMGDHHDVGYSDEKPVHTVYLDAFYMDVYEVTNAQYAEFLNEYGNNSGTAGHELVSIDSSYCLIEKVGSTYSPKSGYEDHPVVEVSWYGAAAYAQFYGKRLPTEAQWEKAARGGLVGRKYPWGDEIDPGKANYDHDGSRGYTIAEMLKYLKAVGSYSPNGYGLYDMAGNVWEWCADWYESGYYGNSPERNPTGLGSGTYRVVRGGSWFNYPSLLRAANRYYNYPTYTYDNIGFRCVSQD